MTPGAPGHVSAPLSGDAQCSFFLKQTFRFHLSDSSGMWEDNDVDEAGDGEDEDEDEGLAGQLLSDLIASNKYGTTRAQFPRVFTALVFLLLTSPRSVVPSQMRTIMRMMKRMIQTL